MADADDELLTTDEPVLDEDLRQEMEQRLLEEREQAQEALNQALEEESTPPATSAGDLSRVPSHMADAGSYADEADTDFQVAERNSDRINLIDEALHRLRERPDAYGVCQVCGEAIEVERLRLVPWTVHCAEHAP